MPKPSSTIVSIVDKYNAKVAKSTGKLAFAKVDHNAIPQTSQLDTASSRDLAASPFGKAVSDLLAKPVMMIHEFQFNQPVVWGDDPLVGKVKFGTDGTKLAYCDVSFAGETEIALTDDD